MTWSSADPFGASGGRAGGNPGDWQWAELGTPPPSTAEERARMEELHAQEIEAAYARGRAEGEELARAAARREVASALSVARQVVREVQESRAGWDARLNENLVALSTAMARRIVERELRGDPEGFRQLASEAVASFPKGEAVRIRLNPTDLDDLAGLAPDGDPSEALTADRQVRWIADEDVVAGGCVVEGPDRIVDGRVDEALRRLYLMLTHD